MPHVFPERSFQRWMPGRKSARRALAMHPHFAKIRVPFFLHKVVADLVNQLKLGIKRLTKSFGDLLEDNQAIDNSVVSASRDRVQVITVMARVGREIAQVYVRDRLWLLGLRHLEIVCGQTMPKPARACVRLHEESLRLFRFLQFNKVVAAAE